MRAGWFVAIAASFYFFVVALFWPIEKQIVPTATRRVASSGYAEAQVIFSDDHLRVRIPSTAKLQEKGLAGVDRLSDAEGMLWVYESPRRVAFWMKGMLIPLDFVWISDNHIVDLSENVQPPLNAVSTDLPIIEPGVPVTGVLEVAAGYVQRHGLKIGDVVEIQ